MDLSLEQLAHYRLTSMSRKTERLRDVAAAGDVITRDDILRSGASSIPEALRLVPGIEVAQLSARRWAVTARGFNGRFANKLLVLIDGRSIYSPIFSGVIWEDEDLLLDDVEQIEVVRGPGAALWGANAVNGVINIVTRHTRDTIGTRIISGVDSNGGAQLSGRNGERIGDNRYVRAYAHIARGGALPVAAADAPDTSPWRSRRAGFRLDDTSNDARLMLSGDVYASAAGVEWVSSAPGAQVNETRHQLKHSDGANVLMRYQRTLDNGSQATLQSYANHARIDLGPARGERNELDADIQLRSIHGAHDVIWGLAYRWTAERFSSDAPFVAPPSSSRHANYSFFLHDELTLAPGRFKLIAGTKVEQDELAGFSWQPNLRAIWTPSSTQAVWAAASRAIRTLSHAGNDFTLELTSEDLAIAPGIATRVLPRIVTRTDSLAPETALSLELGYRQEVSKRLRFDVAAYATRYRNMRSVVADGLSCPADAILNPAPLPSIGGCPAGTLPSYVALDAHLDNDHHYTAHGIELGVDWQAAPWWRLNLSYSNLLLRGEHPDNALDEIEVHRVLGSSPRYQLGLRSSMNLTGGRKLDLWLRHVARLREGDIPAYTTLDARFAWPVTPTWEMAVVGKNLLDERHVEFRNAFPNNPSEEVERMLAVQATWTF